MEKPADIAKEIPEDPPTPAPAKPLSAKQKVAQTSVYNPKSLSVRISYKCNIGCRFCYNTSLPDSKIALDQDRVMEMIKEGAEHGLNGIGISGGEAFLYANSVMEMIKTSKQNGYKGTSIVTNGFWGKSEKSASNLIGKLAAAGWSPPRDMLTMSAGEYHQEWIPLSYCRNAIKEYYRAFAKPMEVNFEITQDKEHLVEEFHDYMKENGVSTDWYNLRTRRLIANLGRGKEELEEGTTEAKPARVFGKCNAINRFAIQPDGKVVPCCGFNRFNDGLTLGNIYEHSVAEIIEMGKTNVINRLLIEKPMWEIYEELKPHFDMPEKYCVSCELCEAMFGTREHVEYLEQNAEQLLGPEKAET